MKSITLPVAIAATLLLAACGADQQEAGPAPDPIPRSGDLRFFNAMGDVPDLVVIRNGSTLGALPFGQTIAQDNAIVGRYRIDMGYLDADNEFVAVVDQLEIELHEDHERTVVATGTQANPSFTVIENEEFLYGVVGVPVQDPQVQFIHTVAGIGDLDFHLTAPGDPLLATPSSLAFEGRTAIDSTPPGDYRLRVTPAGQPGTILYDSGTFTLASTTRTELVAIGYFGPGGNGIRVVAIDSFGGVGAFPEEDLPAAVRFANFAADLPSADVFLDDPMTTPATFSDVAFEAVTPYDETLASGTTTFQITAAMAPDPVLRSHAVNVRRGAFATYYLGGTATADPPVLTGALVVDDNRVSDLRSQVRFFQASPAAGIVNVFLLAPGQSTVGATPNFRSASSGNVGIASLAPTDYDLVIEDAQGANLYGPERITLTPSVNYLLTITDVAGGGAPFVVNFGPVP